MIGHYLTIALRNFKRSRLATCINIFALALGLACFVVAYAVVSYWNHAEQGFKTADRTYVVTMSARLSAQRKSQSRVTMTATSPDAAGYLKSDFSDTADRTYVVTMSARLSAQRKSQSRVTMTATSPDAAGYLKSDFSDFESVARLVPRDTDDMGVMTVLAGTEKTTITSAYADPEFLRIFDLPFIEGDPKEALSRPDSVVLTKAAAARLFGKTDPMGQHLVIDNVTEATVTGVIGEVETPSHINGGTASAVQFELLASFDMYEKFWNVMSGGASAKAPRSLLSDINALTYILLPEGSGLTNDALNERLAAFTDRHIPANVQALMHVSFAATPVRRLLVDRLDELLFQGTDVGMSITTVLMGLGGLILIVACLNYANLATAIAMKRAREVGLRKTLGAGRGQIALQYLFEAALMAVIALLLALAITKLVAPLFRQAAGIDLDPALFSSAGFWAFLAGLVVVVTLLAGSYPAFVLSRVRPVTAMRSGGLANGSRIASALLVGGQFAAASFLLVTVIAMYAQSRELSRTVLDAKSDPIVVITNMSGLTKVKSEELRDALARIPQVTSVSGNREQPWALSVNTMMLTQSRDAAAAQRIETYFERVDYDYFSTLGVKLLAGRVFDRAHDDPPIEQLGSLKGNALGIVVDRDFTRQMGFSSPQAAIDKLIYMPPPEGSSIAVTPVFRIIGVVEARPSRFIGMGAASTVYFRSATLPFQIARISGRDVPGALAAIRATWDRLAPGVPLNLSFMDDLFGQTYTLFTNLNRAFLALVFFAFTISIIGLIGMASHIAGKRTHEIGVRKTMGASTSQVLAMLLKDFARPVVIANIIAWPFAYMAARVYLNLFVTRIALTPTPFALSLLITLLVAWGAVGAQAWRAARVKPAKVLRYE